MSEIYELEGPLPEATAKALRGSVAKWQSIVENIQVGRDYEERGVLDCPLCQLFNNTTAVLMLCVGCPVAATTNEGGCRGTPYDMWADEIEGGSVGETLENAQAMLDFLKAVQEKYDA